MICFPGLRKYKVIHIPIFPLHDMMLYQGKGERALNYQSKLFSVSNKIPFSFSLIDKKNVGVANHTLITKQM